MTNYLDKAERAYDHGASDDRVSALALLSIAQQLRIMNLIKTGYATASYKTLDGLVMPAKRPLVSEVAEALGIPEEK